MPTKYCLYSRLTRHLSNTQRAERQDTAKMFLFDYLCKHAFMKCCTLTKEYNNLHPTEIYSPLQFARRFKDAIEDGWMVVYRENPRTKLYKSLICER